MLDGKVSIIIYSAVLQKNEETNNIKKKSLIFFLGILKMHYTEKNKEYMCKVYFLLTSEKGFH